MKNTYELDPASSRRNVQYFTPCTDDQYSKLRMGAMRGKFKFFFERDIETSVLKVSGPSKEKLDEALRHLNIFVVLTSNK